MTAAIGAASELLTRGADPGRAADPYSARQAYQDGGFVAAGLRLLSAPFDAYHSDSYCFTPETPLFE